MCGWSPRTPPHSCTRPSEKHDPFIYFPYRKLTPFIYYFWKLTPFIYYFSNFTHSYTFWVKKIPHWYTFDVKMIPIHILGGLKSIPHSSRTSVYTIIMEVTPPCLGIILLSSCIYVWNMKFKAECCKLVKLSCQNQSITVTLTIDSKISHHPASMYENLYIENYSNYRVRTKVLTDRQTYQIPIGHLPSGGS